MTRHTSGLAPRFCPRIFRRGLVTFAGKQCLRSTSEYCQVGIVLLSTFGLCSGADTPSTPPPAPHAHEAPPAGFPAQKPSLNPEAPTAATAVHGVRLPTLIIEGTRVKNGTTPAPLLPEEPIFKNTDPSDPFITGKERDQRMIEKHLSPFDYNILNKFEDPLLPTSTLHRAKDAELREKNIQLINETDTLLRVSKIGGALSPEDQKTLRELQRLEFSRQK